MSNLSRKRRLLLSLLLIGVLVVVIAGVLGFLQLRSRESMNRFRVARNFKFEPDAAPEPARDTKAEPGDTIVELSPADLRKADIHTELVTSREASSSLRVPGVIQANAYRDTQVNPVAGGVVTSVNVQLGDRVHRGQFLARIFSDALAEAESGFLATKATLEADHQRQIRTANLLKIGAASRQELDDVDAEHAAHAAHVSQSREKLSLLGLTESQITRLAETGTVSSQIDVPAPVDGVVIARSANPGQVVTTAQSLFDIADLSSVWIIGDLYERDFASVHVGSKAEIETEAYPGRKLTGTVSYISPSLDAQTRTAKVRLEVPNRGDSLRIGMYASVNFRVGSQRSGPQVPETAVQAIGSKEFVFLPASGVAGRFLQREIEIQPGRGGFHEVIRGLAPGDRVVASGSFILKSESVRQNPGQR
jgi:membrane fusion protein, heavy metal efflux system